MRIAHVNLASGFRGGERQTVLLIRNLARFGLSQVLVCKKKSPLRSQLADVDGLVFVSAKNQLSGHLKCPDVDIVHAHEAKGVHWAYLHYLLRRIPYVITRRVDAKIKNKLFNRLTYGRAARRVSISNEIRELMSSSGFGESTLIHSASANFKPDSVGIEKIKSQYEGCFLIGQAGALVDKHKGQRIAIGAAKILEGKYPGIKFIFLGSGEDEAVLKSESKGFRNILWLGFKDNVADYISALDLFIFPSRNEGLGSVLLDVMNLNVPIIATNVGGIPDIVKDRETGLLIKPNSALALADAIEELYLDAELRKTLVNGASVFVKDFSPEIMAGKYYSTYQDILKKIHNNKT